MPKRNALYDPNSIVKHRRHAAERDQMGVLLRGCNSSRAGRRLRSRMQAAYGTLHQASLETFKTRYATVQEYARWRFKHWAGGDEALALDFEMLGSVEEVDQLYRLLKAEGCTAKVSGLPVGQAPGMPAFSGGDSQSWLHLKAGSVDVIPDLPDAGRDSRPSGCLSTSPLRTGEQAGKGMVRRVARSLAEPALIAGAALLGAIMGYSDDRYFGNYPVLAWAGLLACLATWLGLVKFMARSERTGARVSAGVAIRGFVMLVCLGFDLYGSACVCDTVPRMVIRSPYTFP